MINTIRSGKIIEYGDRGLFITRRRWYNLIRVNWELLLNTWNPVGCYNIIQITREDITASE